MTSSSKVQKLTSGIIQITGITVFDSEIETGIENAFLLFSTRINSESPTQNKTFFQMKIFLLFTTFSSLLACENCKGGASGCDYLYYSEYVFPVLNLLPVMRDSDIFYQKMILRGVFRTMLEHWLI